MDKQQTEKKVQAVPLEQPVAATVPKLPGDADKRLRVRTGLRAGENRNNGNRLFDSQTILRGRTLGYRERSGRPR